MKLRLERFNQDKVTFGKLIIEGAAHKDIYTIELPWKDNKRKISCIPEGTYECVPYTSPKYKNVWHILDVPGRDAILIHSGNFASDVNLLGSSHKSDTEGCVMIGLGIEENVPMITRSKEAIEYLRSLVGDDGFSIEVKNP